MGIGGADNPVAAPMPSGRPGGGHRLSIVGKSIENNGSRRLGSSGGST